MKYFYNLVSLLKPVIGLEITTDGWGVLDSHEMQPRQELFFIVLANIIRREPKDVIIAITATVDESII